VIVRHDNGCVVDTRRREGWLAAAEHGDAPGLLCRVSHADDVMAQALLLEVERVYWVRRLVALLGLLS